VTIHGRSLEQQTFRLHLIHSLLLGASMGIIRLQEVIAKKTLAAQDWEIAALVMAWPVANITSVYWARWSSRRHRLRPYVLLAGVVRAAPVAALVIVAPLHLVPISMAYYSAGAFVIPALNSVFQSNYSPSRRGRLLGYSTSATTAALAVTCYVAGQVLTHHEAAFRTILAVSGGLGFLSCWVLSRIPSAEHPRDEQAGEQTTSVRTVVSALRKNRTYLLFQRNFFLYGVSFIMLLPVMPIFMVDNLSLSYATISIAQGVAAQIPIAILAPLAGRLHDRTNPSTYSAWCFLTIGTVPLLLLLAPTMPPHKVFWVLLAFTVQGVAMAGLFVVWTIGSLHFAGPTEAAPYQSIHVSLTGVRGLLAPVLGLAVYRLGGIRAVLLVSSAMSFVASILMARLGKVVGTPTAGDGALPALQSHRAYDLPRPSEGAVGTSHDIAETY
jgi:MFS family permease